MWPHLMWGYEAHEVPLLDNHQVSCYPGLQAQVEVSSEERETQGDRVNGMIRGAL